LFEIVGVESSTFEEAATKIVMIYRNIVDLEDMNSILVNKDVHSSFQSAFTFLSLEPLPLGRLQVAIDVVSLITLLIFTQITINDQSKFRSFAYFLGLTVAVIGGRMQYLVKDPFTFFN